MRSRIRQLNHDFNQVLARYPKERSHGTRKGRGHAMDRMATTLDRRFPGLRARNLKGKHVEFLVADWKERELSIGKMANYMAHLRWFAKAIGKPNIVRRDNTGYDIVKELGAKNRACGLPADRLAQVRDVHVRMALRMELAFGLRREEAVKFSPTYADRSSKIALQASTTKVGLPRQLPVLKEEQRGLLDEVRALVGGGALIRPDRNYREQLKVYDADGQRGAEEHARAALHGRAGPLRGHRGWKCPVAGGPPQNNSDEREGAA